MRRNREAASPEGGPGSRSGAGQPVRDREDFDWRAYDSIAQNYARVFAPQLAVPAADLVELLRVGEGDLVLDVGTGTGAAAEAAAERTERVVGVDPSLPMLALAGSAGGRPCYAAAVAIDLPFRDGTFDKVTANFVLSHFTRYETALFDIFRVLRPGGRFGGTAWGPGDDQDDFSTTWQRLAEEHAEHAILQDAHNRAVPWEEHFSDPIRFKESLHDAGLRDMVVDKRTYRFEISTEDYVTGRETASMGRFLRQMLGEEMWEIFRRRAREVFAERFPPRFNDFRDVIFVVGTKP
jgi:ubiquinone/menaquinone biosynthesis C-methylase UbiE